MRVLNLKMTAFGPYAEETEIDFGKFGKGGIYIVTGDTGAGKTTIFDGISFALFGEASGERRSAKTLRSKYADDDVATKVELTFEYRDKVYKIERSPEYMRPSKRAGGLVRSAPDAVLFLPDGRVVYKVDAVNKEIFDLIGVTKAQFNRIAMIAQGDFLNLLLASTEERIKIFRKIFGTEKYEALQSAISAEYGVLEAKMNKLNADYDEIISACADTAKLTRDEAYEYLKKKIEEDRALYKENRRELKELNDKLSSLNERLGGMKIKGGDLKQLRETEGKIPELRVKLEGAKERLDKAEKFSEKKEKLTACIQAELGRKGDYDEREVAVKKVKRLNDEIFKLREGIAKVQSDINESEELKRSYSEYVSTHALIPAETEKAKNEVENLKAKYAELKSLSDSLQDCRRKEEALEKEREILEENIRSYGERSREYSSKYETFLRNQAGILASSLKDGEPCPVCGSRSHPNRAKTESKVASEEELQRERSLLDEEGEELNKRTTAAAQAKSALDEKFNSIKQNLLRISGNEDVEGIDGEMQALSLSYEKKKAELEELSAEKKKYEEMSKLIPELEKRISSDREKAENLNAKISDGERESAALNGKISSFSSLRFKDVNELSVQLDSWTKEVRDITVMIDNAEKAYEKTNKELLELQTKRDTLSESVRDYSEAEHEKIKAESAALETEREKKQEALERLQELGSRENADLEKLEKLREGYAQIEESLKILTPVHQTVNGRISGKEKIYLETYVQTRYFDKVVYRANMRLKKMTDGQYELRRREETSDRRSQAGLELDVIDFTNDSVRPASTLSGGESFMASLSLALGLSDEIQSASGGIKIDSMFIDEGFGSLSDQALDNAIDTLTALSDGDVMIGIISHVDKLRERIDRQLIVTKDAGGSKVKVVT